MASCPGPPVKDGIRSSGRVISRRPKASAYPVAQAENTQAAESSPLARFPLNPAADERELIFLYGLTRGEAAQAVKLVQGKSIDRASAELCISTYAARSHLKRILMKTDARHLEIPIRHRAPVQS